MFLTQHLDAIELIIANSDAMALGAVRSLNEIGYNLGNPGSPRIPVIGVDATPQAMEAIAMGKMAGTVKQDSDLMGKIIVTLLLNAVHDKPLREGIDLPWDESGVAIRIPHSPVGGY